MMLLIFGLILFPSEENFVDLIAVNIFLAVKIGDEDPTPALLADVYYTLHQRHVIKWVQCYVVLPCFTNGLSPTYQRICLVLIL